ncbi:MAG: filamentous hemagglutinin family protein [Pseudomonadota bacterium]
MATKGRYKSTAVSPQFPRRLLSLAVCAACAGWSAASAVTPLPSGTVPTGGKAVSGATINDAIPTATGKLLTIDQTAQKAILNWQTFNIANGSEVLFNQPNAGAAALNRIGGNDPSLIQGKLTANGQVYLINQNGILFDRDSQVNVGGLVASSLNITDKVFDAGFGPYFNDPAFEGGGVGGIKALGQIKTDSGGSVMLFGPTVEHSGVISAPDGQVILAAGKTVYLSTVSDGSTASFAKNTSADNTQMRGMLVEIKAGDGDLNLTSLVTNTGAIHADHGNITLAGLVVNQMNLVSAKSSVFQNGSIFLVAKERGGETGTAARTGQVLLGTGSVTETPLDTADATTLAEDQSYDKYRSLIGIEGKTITHQGRITSPGGKIALYAYDPQNAAGTRVYLDDGSAINAAGSWADLAMSKNLLNIQITSSETKDSPLQRDGLLPGTTVTVDARKGTPLFDISGYLGAVKRGIAEKAATGGDITLESQGDVIQRGGALLDVSGGGYRYAGGYYATTKLTSGGKVYDIGNAPNDVRYDGMLDSYAKIYAKWGVTEHYQGPAKTFSIYESGYAEGKAAGSLTVRAAGGLVLGGSIKANVTAGRYQQDAANFLALADSGKLVVGDNTAYDAKQENNFKNGDVVFYHGADPLAVTPFGVTSALSSDYAGNAILPYGVFGTLHRSAEGSWVRDGVGSVALYANGSITVPKGETITLPEGGTVSLAANKIEVNGDIVAPAGSVSLMGASTFGKHASLPTVVLGAGSQVSTDGLWINDALAGTAAGSPPLLANGGTVAISTHVLTLDPTSRISANGGGRMAVNGAVTKGNGGALKLAAVTGTPFVQGFALGQLSAFGLGKGGTLALNALGNNGGVGGLTIGGPGPGANKNPYELWLSEDFFRQGGFTKYSVNTEAGTANIAADALLAPVAQNWQLDSGRAATQATGARLADVAIVKLLPVEQRTATSLTVSAGNGNLVMAAGASIVTDPQASVTLSAANSMEVDGRIEAPAGAISLNAGNSQINNLGNALHLGPNAQLLSPGYVLRQPNAQSLQLGRVLAGGSVSLNAYRAELNTDAGSLIDVSGVSADLDIVSKLASAAPVQRRHIAGDAGSVSVGATLAAGLHGVMRAQAEAGSVGGAFTLSMANPWDNPKDLVGETLTNSLLSRRVVVSDTNSINTSPVGDAVEVRIALPALRDHGFDKVALSAQNTLLFDGDLDVTLNRGLKLDAPEIAATSGSTVNLRAPQVRLGSTTALVVATATGNAQLNIFAGALRPDGTRTPGVLDWYGNTVLNGFKQVNMFSNGDMRATGLLNGTDLRGSLTTTANLYLTADQLYPTTFSDYTLAVKNITVPNGVATSSPLVDGSIQIASTGHAPAEPWSAFGTLTLDADTIDQGGVIRVPLGQINLNAQRLNLLPDSRTSVAGSVQSVPFGGVLNGQEWRYAGIPITRLPHKTINLNGAGIHQAAGAVVDVSGGGDVQAVAFVPGPGGSKDVLVQPGTFAILPGTKGQFAPIDTDLQQQGQGMVDGATYDGVYVSGTPDLEAGIYPLLPAYYALLPGAYRITPAGAKFADMPRGVITPLPGGIQVVAGYGVVSGSDLHEARWSGYALSSNAQVHAQSEYAFYHPDFLAKQAMAHNAVIPLPQDAGRVSIQASQSLTMQGQVLTAAALGGEMAQVDIAATQIAVVADANTAVPAGYLRLDAATLSAMNASVLLGGTRSNRAPGQQITVSADQVLVANDAQHALQGPEFMLVAKNDLKVRPGSAIRATGTASSNGYALYVSGNGALLRVSAGAEVPLTRTGSDGTAGNLTVASGAVLDAGGSLMLDASGNTQFAGDLKVASGGALSLGAKRVSLGVVDGIGDGLVLSNAQLASLTGLGSLSLRSYGSMDLYGDVALGGAKLQRLNLQSAGLAGYQVNGHNAAVISADTVSLANNGSVWQGTPDGAGDLVMSARQIVISGGDQQIKGFSNVTVSASQDISGRDSGSLTASGALKLSAGRISTASGSDQRWLADSVVITRLGTGTGLPALTGLGGRLEITGITGLTDTGNIDLPAGRISLTATRGDLVIGDGARIAAAGVQKTIGHRVVFALAGAVALDAEAGQVQVSAGAVIDLSGAAAGGNAGSLSVCSRDTAILAGTLKATAQPGYQQGTASLDVGSMVNFSDLNTVLNQAGFTEARQMRVRNGDVVIAATDTVNAHTVNLAVDGGSITLAGKLDASAVAGGGAVTMTAGKDVILVAGSVIDVSGTSAASGAGDAYAHGGKVDLSAVQGALAFDRQSLIDVSAGAKGNGGQVSFTAPRTLAQDGVAATLAGTVRANAGAGGKAGQVVVVGNRSYSGISTINSGVTGAIVSNPVWADTQAFMSNAPAMLAGLGGLQGIAPENVHVRPGLELQSAGDMALVAGWDLTKPAWLQGNEPGVLTLRAAGTVNINSYLGFPNDNLSPLPSWTLRLTGGADLAAADSMAVLPLSQIIAGGDVKLNNNGSTAVGKLRTGTGDIVIAAGRDVIIAGPPNPAITSSAAVIYTAGSPGVPGGAVRTGVNRDTALGTQARQFPVGGGNIVISAQRDVVGAAAQQQWLNQWYRRTTGNGVALDGQAAEWWVDRTAFTHNVGSLAGGDLRVSAGQDIRSLSVMLPTTGRIYKDETGASQIDVQGGGNLSLLAGRDVIGGEFLVARGLGVMTTGGTFGTSTAKAALFLMGVSNDRALEGANIRVQSIGDISLQGVANPTALFLPRPTSLNVAPNNKAGATFFTYAPASGVELLSLTGNVALGDSLSSRPSDAPLVYAPRLSVTAIQGSIAQAVPSGGVIPFLKLFPSTLSELSLIAGNDIFSLNMKVSDVVPRMAASWQFAALQTFGGGQPAPTRLLPVDGNRIVSTEDSGYRYQVDAGGDIANVTITLPQKSWIEAGRDITDTVQFTLQNLGVSDLSVVKAGKDIILKDSMVAEKIQLGGPGALLVQAGRNIDLGASYGIMAVGNDYNPSLPASDSAHITVIAGVRGDVPLRGIDALFEQLSAAGQAKDAALGTAAIAGMFNLANIGPGDITMYTGANASKVTTAHGSGIDILVPHGSVYAGPLTMAAPLSAARQAGIMTFAGGPVRAYLSGDFNINQSKIVTLLGGDILLYSAFGSIDAGRGARDSRATQPPKKITNNKDGTSYYSIPADVSGSGIRTSTSDPDGPGPLQTPAPGNVYLFAPGGTIDAGEAGISSAGNVVIAALHVANAANISFSGSATGVPVMDTGGVSASMVGASSLAAGAGDVSSTAKAMTANAQANQGQTPAKHLLLTVEVIGVGEDGGIEIKKKNGDDGKPDTMQGAGLD